MNIIVENFLNIHINEYALESMKKETAFEHFINRLIINKYSSERFEPSDIMTDDGEVGIDGIAIIVNNILVLDEDSLDEAFKLSTKIETKFIFIQSKTSEKFDGDEIGTFFYGVKSFFLKSGERPKTNEKIERLATLKDMIYSRGVDLQPLPTLDFFYVTCGKWNEGNNLSDRIRIESNYFDETQNFSKVRFYPYDNEKIIDAYKELKKKISKRFFMEKKFSFPQMLGIKQAYTGLIKCEDYINILKDNEGNMLKNIFEDNVRDFQGYNAVNMEIKATLENSLEQGCFAVLNNGVTIVAKKIDSTGDEIEIFDYQIVNGCQTSYVLFDNEQLISDNVFILAKIIEVSSDKILDRIIYTTNRQTEVKSEAFTSAKPYHKRLEDYFDSIEPAYKLYYERRSKQYELLDSINKNQVVSLSGLTYAYISMFLNIPHSSHRYYGELLQVYDKQIFIDESPYEQYYVAAYFSYYIGQEIRNNRKPKKYTKFRYHLACAMKVLAVGSSITTKKVKALKKQCEILQEIINSTKSMNDLLDSAVSCLDKAIKENSQINFKNLHRSRELTNSLLDIANKLTVTKNSTNYLKKGNTVQCVVTAIKRYYAIVEIKTDDDRNFGQIHISKIAKRYVENIEDELQISQLLEAVIVNEDFYESGYGWELSLIY